MGKITSRSTMPVNTIADTDIFLISKDNGDGTFTSYKLTGAQLKLNYQSLLVSGTNIKTINGTSILGSGDITVSASASVPQTDVIYVDPVLGSDDASANRGNIEKPYATVEYALSATTNTGTINGNTTNGSNTISGVSSTTGIKVGQYITGTNIPYNSIVVSKTSNTIVLNQTTTGTGSGLTITYWTPKIIKLNGNVVATGNWFKPGFWYDCGTSNITWGNFALFSKTVSCLVPEIINGGNWYGNHSGSQFLYSNSISSSHDISVDIISLHSIGTGYQVWLANATAFRNFTIRCNIFDARFGSIASVNGTYTRWSGYKYGLLNGIGFGGQLEVEGKTECPASVNAIINTSVSNHYAFIKGPVFGSVNINLYHNILFNDYVIGTTFTCNADVLVCNGPVLVTTANIGSGRGNSTFNGPTYGSWTCAGNTEFNAFAGSFIASSGKHIVTANDNYNGGLAAITTSGNAVLYLNGESYTSDPYGMININLGTGSTIYNSARLKFRFVTNCAGTFVNYGNIAMNYGNGTVPLTGTFENVGSFELVRGGHGENATYTPFFNVSTGTLILNGGKLFCNHIDSKSGLIRKTASGGKVVLKGQPYLKVANGLAPLQILSNTGTAQDVLDFSMVGNGASGYRLGDTFSDTTYGTAYAPNLLVNGTKYEGSNYSY